MGKLTNLNPPAPIADADLPASIARDAEYIAADIAHLNATDPHLQYPTQARADARYVRLFNSFEQLIPAPINWQANTWQALGNSIVAGELSKPALWDVCVYVQYVDTSNNTMQPYFQYCGGGTLAAIYWQADVLTNEGISVPFEAHNEADFTARLRFGRGNQFRKLEIKPDRTITITSPGFCIISGVRKI